MIRLPPFPDCATEVRRLMRARVLLLRAVPEARARSLFHRNPAEVAARLAARGLGLPW